MSIEAINQPGVSDEEKRTLRIEALECYRRELQDTLRILSVNLYNITQQYNGCINEIIVTNAQLEAYDIGEGEPNAEALDSYRKELQERLEILRANLDSVNQQYSDCIHEILVTNAWLAAYSADTEGLAREIQAGVVHPASL